MQELGLLRLALAATGMVAPRTRGNHLNALTAVASYDSTQGNGNAKGDDQMTAACADLPVGTRVRITNLKNNRSVVVRVTDRGLFLNGRQISVTRHAARHLGFVKAGSAQVRIEHVS